MVLSKCDWQEAEFYQKGDEKGNKITKEVLLYQFVYSFDK